MHRFYLPTATGEADSLVLSGPEAHHAAQVLRVRAGEEISILNGDGTTFQCEVQHATHGSVATKVLQRKELPEPRCKLTLLQGLPKGKIIEDIIEKATELGVAQVVPLLTERVVTKLDGRERKAKQQKWQAVAVEAIKQCGQAWLPKVEEPQTVSEFLLRKQPFDIQVVGSLRSNAEHPRTWFNLFGLQTPSSCAIWVGPEGDFTPSELDQIEAAGAKPISLGRLVLRCETAAVFCLSIVNYELFATPSDRQGGLDQRPPSH